MYIAESSLSFCAGTVWVSIADEKIYLHILHAFLIRQECLLCMVNDSTIKEIACSSQCYLWKSWTIVEFEDPTPTLLKKGVLLCTLTHLVCCSLVVMVTFDNFAVSMSTSV